MQSDLLKTIELAASQEPLLIKHISKVYVEYRRILVHVFREKKKCLLYKTNFKDIDELENKDYEVASINLIRYSNENSIETIHEGIEDVSLHTINNYHISEKDQEIRSIGVYLGFSADVNDLREVHYSENDAKVTNLNKGLKLLHRFRMNIMFTEQLTEEILVNQFNESFIKMILKLMLRDSLILFFDETWELEDFYLTQTALAELEEYLISLLEVNAFL